MCKELLFVGIYSNNASAWLKFKNVCRCVYVHVYHASALKKTLLRVPHHLQPDHRLKSPPLFQQQEIAAFMLWVIVTGKISHSRTTSRKLPPCKDHRSGFGWGLEVDPWVPKGQNKPGRILSAHLRRWLSSSGAAPGGSLHKGSTGALLFPTLQNERRQGREKTRFSYAAWLQVSSENESKEKDPNPSQRSKAGRGKLWWRLECVGKRTVIEILSPGKTKREIRGSNRWKPAQNLIKWSF